MKSFLNLLLLGGLMLTGCIGGNDNSPKGPLAPRVASESINPENMTTIMWIDSVKEFKNVLEGQKLEVVFRFRNTGAKPLVIESVTPSCGCTVPSKPDEPVLPGNEGEIKAIFDSEGRVGTNHKSIAVVANTEGGTAHNLVFNVQVLGKTDGPKPVEASPKQF